MSKLIITESIEFLRKTCVYLIYSLNEETYLTSAAADAADFT